MIPKMKILSEVLTLVFKKKIIYYSFYVKYIKLQPKEFMKKITEKKILKFYLIFRNRHVKKY